MMYQAGLVLEGGGNRAIYTSGVLDAFMDQGITFPYVIGVSAGSCNAVSYIGKCRGRQHDISIQYSGDKRFMSLENMIKNGEFLNGEWLFGELSYDLSPLDQEAYDRANTTLCVVVTNALTGKAEYMEVPRRDEKFLLLQATCALPLMFPIYHLDGKPYLDGGASDAIPFRRAFDQGCDRAIVILTKPRNFVRKAEKLQPLIERKYRQYPNFCQTMRERAEKYNADKEELFELERQGKVLIFAPDSLHGVGRIEHNVEKLRLLWGEGYQHGVERMEELESFLGR